jgi:hypothetical protein
MAPDQIVVLLVLLFSVFLGWTLYRGRTAGIRLYLVAATVAASLLLGSLARALDLRAAAEVLIVTAIALSLALLPAHPGIWEDQIRADLERTRVYQRWRAADVLSWRAWLKLVDRVGARSAALAYLGVFFAAIALAFIATSLDPRAQAGTSDRAAYLFASLPPALLAVLSTIWIYRSARRLVPGA